MTTPDEDYVPMYHEYCKIFHYDESEIARTLALLELGPQDSALAELLHKSIIKPHLGQIIDRFYNDYLLAHEPFRKVIGNEDRIPNLKLSQAKYLLSLGIDFDTLDYFENRLRVGVAHQRIGLSLSLYNFAYQKLRTLIVSYLSDASAAQQQLRDFIDKIIALDTSLAIASYHEGSQVKLESSIKHLRTQRKLLEKKASTDTLTHFSSRDMT